MIMHAANLVSHGVIRAGGGTPGRKANRGHPRPEVTRPPPPAHTNPGEAAPPMHYQPTEHRLLRVTSNGSPLVVEGTTLEGEQVFFRVARGRATLLVGGFVIWATCLSDDPNHYLDKDTALTVAQAVLDFRAAHLTLMRQRYPGVSETTIQREVHHLLARLELPTLPV